MSKLCFQFISCIFWRFAYNVLRYIYIITVKVNLILLSQLVLFEHLSKKVSFCVYLINRCGFFSVKTWRLEAINWWRCSQLTPSALRNVDCEVNNKTKNDSRSNIVKGTDTLSTSGCFQRSFISWRFFTSLSRSACVFTAETRLRLFFCC